MRGFVLALQFLTRIPTPQVNDFRPEDLAASAGWFPVIGAIVGGVVAAALALGALVDPWLGALAGVAAWTLVTGALHLDGLADTCDALGAAHRDPRRFLEVLKDPHVGAFGAIAIVLALLAKLVLLMLVARQSSPFIALALVAAWARLGAVIWSQTLPALAPGSAERFAWRSHRASLWLWALVLCAASAWAAPLLLAAPLAIALWWVFLKRRVGGMTGDCLGAGVELCEIAVLALVAVAAA